MALMMAKVISMQTLTTRASLAFASDTVLKGTGSSAHASAQVCDRSTGLANGWWLIPMVLGGAALWAWMISALIG
jgi:hypothetical protein